MRMYFAALAWALLSFPAVAATSWTMNLTLQWEKTRITDVGIWEFADQDRSHYLGFDDLGTIDLSQDVWGLDHLLSGLDLSVPLTLSFRYVTDPGGLRPHRPVSCTFAGKSCTTGRNTLYNGVEPRGDDFTLFTGTVFGYYFHGSRVPGGQLLFNDWTDDTRGKAVGNGYDYVSYRDVASTFTVLDAEETISSMPVPGGLALLPAGLAGLAILRRRRHNG